MEEYAGAQRESPSPQSGAGYVAEAPGMLQAYCTLEVVKRFLSSTPQQSLIDDISLRDFMDLVL